MYSRRGFFYSPTIVIDSGVFADQLFVRPSYCSYYFGDYGLITYVGLLLLWISALITLYTGYDYFRAGIRHLMEEKQS